MKIGDVDNVEVNKDAAAGIAAQVKINNDRDYSKEFIDVRFLIDTLTSLILDLPASDMRSLLPGGGEGGGVGRITFHSLVRAGRVN